ncbi:MAG: aminoacyl-tRNA hydrolase [Candidatus Saccharibacteria bacterium]|nr:aminoacyl-tRNA hydrolase [Candidatus Saccharibacteria bacterium]
MKLIVGLGNPGTRYAFTRHNSGFLALDFYLKRYGGTWSEKPRMGAVFCEREHILADGTAEKVFFIKPQDFYNLSGVAVANYARYYKIPTSDILVICDNFDLAFGKVRFRENGSAGGNNGLKSVDHELSSSNYARIRVGTENPEVMEKVGAVDFVLSRFTPEEKERLPGILNEICDKINEFIG